jgi:hypothetical protein
VFLEKKEGGGGTFYFLFKKKRIYVRCMLFSHEKLKKGRKQQYINS